MKILLLCNNGVTTGMLVPQLKKMSKKEDVVDAYSIFEYENYIPLYDVVLLAPQLKSYYKKVNECAKQHGTICGMISTSDFNINGYKHIFENALSLYKQKDNN